MEEKTSVKHGNELSIQDFKDQLPDSEKTVFNHQLTDTKKEVEKFNPDPDQNAEIDKAQERIKNELKNKNIDPSTLHNMAVYEALQEYMALPAEEKANSPLQPFVNNIYGRIPDELRALQALSVAEADIIKEYNSKVKSQGTTEPDERRRQNVQAIEQDSESRKHLEESGRTGLIEEKKMDPEYKADYQIYATLKRTAMGKPYLIALQSLKQREYIDFTDADVKEILGLTTEEAGQIGKNSTSTELSRIFDQKLARVLSTTSIEQLEDSQDHGLYKTLYGSYDSQGSLTPGILQKMARHEGGYEGYAADQENMVFQVDPEKDNEIFTKLGITDEKKEETTKGITELGSPDSDDRTGETIEDETYDGDKIKPTEENAVPQEIEKTTTENIISQIIKDDKARVISTKLRMGMKDTGVEKRIGEEGKRTVIEHFDQGQLVLRAYKILDNILYRGKLKGKDDAIDTIDIDIRVPTMMRLTQPRVGETEKEDKPKGITELGSPDLDNRIGETIEDETYEEKGKKEESAVSQETEAPITSNEINKDFQYTQVVNNIPIISALEGGPEITIINNNEERRLLEDEKVNLKPGMVIKAGPRVYVIRNDLGIKLDGGLILKPRQVEVESSPQDLPSDEELQTVNAELPEESRKYFKGLIKPLINLYRKQNFVPEGPLKEVVRRGLSDLRKKILTNIPATPSLKGTRAANLFMKLLRKKGGEEKDGVTGTTEFDSPDLDNRIGETIEDEGVEGEEESTVPQEIEAPISDEEFQAEMQNLSPEDQENVTSVKNAVDKVKELRQRLLDKTEKPMGFLIDQLKEFEELVDKIPDLPYLGAIKHTLLGVFEQTKASVSLGGRSPENKSRLTPPQMTKETLNHYIEAIIHQLKAVGYLLPSIKGGGKAIGLVTKILKK